jgi:hypothetical protein
MRARMLAVPLLAAAAALPALAAPASAATTAGTAATTAGTSAVVSYTSHSTTATTQRLDRPDYVYLYPYASELDEATCVAWGTYFYETGSTYGWQCNPDANGDGLFTLWLEGVY